MKFEWDLNKEVLTTRKHKINFSMEKEYDFSNAEQGKFYRPLDELEIPLYLDEKVRAFFSNKALEKGVEPEQIMNAVLLKEMELRDLVN